MSQIVMPNCPTCGWQAILNRGGTKTAMRSIPFVGDDEKVHYHDHNVFTGHFICPKKHEWSQRVGYKCPNCDWHGTPKPCARILESHEERMRKR